MAGNPKKRSLTVAGHRTSISLEDDFWAALKEMAQAQGCSLPELITQIDSSRGNSGLSSAIRSAVLAYYRTRSEHAEN